MIPSSACLAAAFPISRGFLAVSIITSAVFLSTRLPAAAEPSPAAELSPELQETTLSPAAAREKIVALRAEIARHDELYYKKAKPEISDAAYDELKKELLALERAYPKIAEALPAASRVGDDRTGRFPERRHLAPMLSLDKAYSKSEINAFHERVAKLNEDSQVNYVVEPKIDGLAISVTYRHGKLAHAVTRGNGQIGEDITDNVLTIPEIPLALRSNANETEQPSAIPDLVELRGEIFVSIEDFDALNAEREAAGEPLFAHPRNLAAGSAKLSDPADAANRPLSVLFFGYGAYQPLDRTPPSQLEFYRRAKAWGVPVLEPIHNAKGSQNLTAAIRKIQQKRSQYPFPTDGAVVKIDSLDLQNQLGNSPSAPNWALAYKFAPQQAETRLRDIVIQIGRSGLLTPVAVLEPVTLSGSRIERATLHNAATIARMDIRIGDTIYLEKAGEIIPAIVGVNLQKRPPNSQPFTFPKNCPACHEPASQEADSPSLRCLNARCHAQLQRRLEYFASSQAVEIDGLGPATIQSLIASGAISTIPDLYRLEANDLLAIEGFSNVSTKILLDAIKRSKQAELWRFINGLSIPQIGPTRSKDLAAAYGKLETFAAFKAADFEADGIAEQTTLGPSARAALIAYFSDRSNRALLAELLEEGINARQPRQIADTSNQTLNGLAFAFTGRLPGLTRTEAAELVTSSGGSVRSSVTRRVDYLVVGESPESKLGEARQLGITILDETAFLQLIKERRQPPQSDATD